MGASSSSSKVNQKYDTTIINRSDITLLNQTINDYTANTIMENATSCSGGLTQMQIFDMSNAKIKGDLNLNINQSQTGAINFDCIQTVVMTSDIANGIMEKMVSALTNNIDKTIVDKLEALASTKSTSGFASTDFGKSTSEVKIDYKYTDITETHKNISNIMQNSITNNLNLKNIQDCITYTKQSQLVDLKYITVDGNAIIAIQQNQAAEMVAKCVQDSTFSNKIINQVIKDLDLQIDETSKITKQTDIKSEAETERISNGVFESIGNMFSSIFGSYTGIISCIICLCICLLFGFFFYKKFKKFIHPSDINQSVIKSNSNT